MNQDPSLFKIITGEDAAIWDCGRFGKIIQAMESPTQQFPQLIHLIGKRAKGEAYRKLFPNIRLGRRKATGSTNLHLDALTGGCANPILLMDSDPLMEPLSPCEGLETLSDTRKHTLAWSTSTPHSIPDTVMARLSFLFSDVIVIFAQDFEPHESSITRLAEWGRIGSASSLSQCVRPQVLVVVPENSSCMATLQALKRQPRINEIFQSVQEFHWDPKISEANLYKKLKEFMLALADQMLAIRRQVGCLFSASHLEAFYRQAISHTARCIDRPFDFVFASRYGNFVKDEREQHLLNFLSEGFTLGIPDVHLTSVIASGLLMDAYPPEMSLFSPHSVFHSLYKSVCLQATEKATGSSETGIFLCVFIERQMELFHARMSEPQTSAQLHRENLGRGNCGGMRLNSTCLYCLCRQPREPLGCGHMICYTCIRIHGIGVIGAEERFSIPKCFLCQGEGLITTLHPPTASMSILSIDGGGVRGIIPLEFLSIMQESINTPIQELFDMTAATSSGGLAIIGLIIKNWDIKRCIQVFLTLAWYILEDGLFSGVFGFAKRVLRCTLLNSAYGATSMENALKKAFGADQSMLSHSSSGNARKKVLVTATEIGARKCVAFNNYNENTKQHGGEAIGEIPLWKIGRATSAIPGLFPPMKIGSRTFEDGGMGRHNNPIHLARAEARRILPPGVEPDSVLSLGTGTEGENEDKNTLDRGDQETFRRHFVFRLIASIARSTDGEATWGEVFSELNTHSQESHMRFNINLNGPLEITNAGKMASLQAAVRAEPGISQKARVLVVERLISRFYFTLEYSPTNEGDYVRCQGTIRCRGDSRTVALDLIRLMGNMEFITDKMPLGALSINSLERDICPSCLRYQKRVVLHVRCITDMVSIYLKARDVKCKISGFPQPMISFVARQQMDTPFGKSDHGNPGKVYCSSCANKKRKQTHDVSGEKGRGKRRRTTETRT